MISKNIYNKDSGKYETKSFKNAEEVKKHFEETTTGGDTVVTVDTYEEGYKLVSDLEKIGVEAELITFGSGIIRVAA